jgi:hypothetical protein
MHSAAGTTISVNMQLYSQRAEQSLQLVIQCLASFQRAALLAHYAEGLVLQPTQGSTHSGQTSSMHLAVLRAAWNAATYLLLIFTAI